MVVDEVLAVVATPTVAILTYSVTCSAMGDEGLEGVNSPWAMSKDVRPWSTTFEGVESQAPGKNRDDAADSTRGRGIDEAAAIGATSSSTDARSRLDGQDRTR